MADKTDLVEGFRESLKDLAVVLERLAPHCDTVEDLVASVQHALESDVHLALVMSVCTKKR